MSSIKKISLKNNLKNLEFDNLLKIAETERKKDLKEYLEKYNQTTVEGGKKKKPIKPEKSISK